jgi:hypothetical protein
MHRSEDYNGSLMWAARVQLEGSTCLHGSLMKTKVAAEHDAAMHMLLHLKVIHQTPPTYRPPAEMPPPPSSVRLKAIDILNAAAALAFALDPDLSGTIKAGSFNAYGNEQIDQGTITWKNVNTAGSFAQTNLKWIDGPATVDLSNVIAEALFGVVAGSAPQDTLDATGDITVMLAKHYVIGIQEGATSGTGLSSITVTVGGDGSVRVTVGADFLWSYGAQPSNSDANGVKPSSDMYYCVRNAIDVPSLGTVTLASGRSLWVSSNANLTNRTRFRLTLQKAIAGGSSPSAVSDVNVVAFAQQDRPVWISNASPAGAVIDPPLLTLASSEIAATDASSGQWRTAGGAVSRKMSKKATAKSRSSPTEGMTLSSVPREYVSKARQVPSVAANVDDSTAIKEGSFNPYGNGQGVDDVFGESTTPQSVSFMTTLNPAAVQYKMEKVKAMNRSRLKNCDTRPEIEIRPTTPEPPLVEKEVRVKAPRAVRKPAFTAANILTPATNVTTAQCPKELVNEVVTCDDDFLEAVLSVCDVSDATQKWMADVLHVKDYFPYFTIDERITAGEDVPDEGVLNPRPGRPPGDKKENLPRPVPKEKKDDTPFVKKIPLIAKRIAARITCWDEYLDWIYAGERPPEPLVKEVWDLTLRKLGTTTSQDARWVAQGVVILRSDRVIFNGLSSFSEQLACLAMSEGWHVWVDKNFSGHKPRVPVQIHLDGQMDHRPPAVQFEDTSVKVGCYAEYGNKNKVSYDYRDTSILEGSFNPYGNGQGSMRVAFPGNMSEIESLPTLMSAYSANPDYRNGHAMDPVIEVAEISGILSEQGVTMSSGPREDVLRSGVVDANNTITLINDLNAPEALLYPLQLRAAASPHNLVDQGCGLPFFSVGNLIRNCLDSSRQMVLNANGIAIESILSRMSNIRPDQISTSGFRTGDLAALIRREGISNGDTICTLLLKLQLYRLSRAHIQEMSLLPYGSQPGMFDSYTRLADNPISTVHWGDEANAAAILGADCYDAGSGEYFLPAELAGTRPTIAFHVTMASVPNGATVYWLPAGLLMQADKASEFINVCMMAMALAPYPLGIHQVELSTTSITNANATTMYYVPHSDLVRIPGSQALHFILPCANPGPLPDAAGEAEQLALSVAQCGPTAFGQYAAGQILQYSWIQNVVNHDLIDFCGTYLTTQGDSPIDVTTLTKFMYQLGELSGRVGEIQGSWETACVLSNRYPLMYTAPEGAAVANYRIAPNAQNAGNEYFGLLQQSALGILPHFYPGLPHQDNAGYDFYYPGTNPSWLNKCFSGIYVINHDIPTLYDPVQPKSWDGSARLLQYSRYVARSYAVTWESIIQLMQMSAEVWNSSFTQQNYVGVMQMIRKFYVSARAGAGVGDLVSVGGESLGGLHMTLNGSVPACDTYGYTLYDRINVPIVGFAGPYTYAGVEQDAATPCILPDVWYQLTCHGCYLANCQMLSSNKRLTGITIPDGQITPLGGGSYTTPCPRDLQAREVSLSSKPKLNDAMLFNQRQVWNSFAASIYTMNGVIYAGAVPATSTYPAQRFVTPDWTNASNVPPSRLTAKSTWIPFMTVDGLRLMVGVTAANGAALMSQIMAKATSNGLPMWLLRDVTVMPNTIVDGGGYATEDWVPSRRSLKNDSTSSVPDSAVGHSPPQEPQSTLSYVQSEQTA